MRRRAAAKFADPSDWLFTDEALQQATAAAGRRAPGPSAGRRDGARRHLLDRHRACGTAQFGRLRVGQRHRSGAAGHGAPQRRPTWTLCRADALRPVTRDAVVVADPARRRCGRRRFDPRDYTPRWTALLDVYRDRDLVVKCAPGIDFDEIGGSASPVRSRSRRWTATCARRVCGRPGLAEAGRAPSRHHAGRSPNRSPTPNPTTARWRPRAVGSSTPTARWSGRAGPPLRRAARAVAARPRHRLPVRRPAARRRPRLRGARANSASARSGCVRRCRRMMRVRSRSWCAASTSTPTRCGGGCGCVGRIGVGGDHPHRLRHGKSGNGIHLPALAVTTLCRRRYCDGGGYGAAPAPEVSSHAHFRCGFSPPRRLCSSVGPALRPRCLRRPRRRSARISTGALVGQNCVIQDSDAGYTLSIDYPANYPDEQAVFDYVKQTRDGFVNVAKMPDSRTMPYQLEVTADRVQLGGSAAGHAVGGVQGLPGRRRGAPADLLQGVQLGPGLRKPIVLDTWPGQMQPCSGRAPIRGR